MSSDVRLARLEDLAELVALGGEVQSLHYAERPRDFKPFSREEIASWFEARLAHSDSAIWLAERHGSIAGYLTTIVHTRAATPFTPERSWLEIDQIAVRAERRRAGIGSALVEHALKQAREQGATNVELTSWSFNQPAHAFFRKLGFTPKITCFELTSR